MLSGLYPNRVIRVITLYLALLRSYTPLVYVFKVIRVIWAIRVIKEISQYLLFLNFFFSLSAENPKFFKVNLKLFESYFCELICI